MGASKSREEFVEVTLNQFLEGESAWEISLSDIVNTDEYKELCPTPQSCDQEDLYTLLYKLGMDTDNKVTQQMLSHRNWKGEVVNCPRWVGTKRKDPEWTKLMKSLNKYQN